MSENIHDKERLKELQALPLERKILITQARIIEWYSRHNGQVYVSFSGGKDSTVLLDIARKCFPDIEAVFIDTRLEYPEIRAFAKSYDNVAIIRPKMRFDEVIKTYGYPLISKEVSKKISEYRSKPDGYTNLVFNPESKKIKRYGTKYDMSKWIPLRDSDIPISHKCCDVMKKAPAHLFEKATGKKPIIATLAEESALRRRSEWIRSGCNAFEGKRPISKPMSFWTEQDVLAYLHKYNIPIAAPYGNIIKNEAGKYQTTNCDRTGCIFCAFGCHRDSGESRFQRLKKTHPRQYEYCINGGEYVYEAFKRDENGEWQEFDMAWEYDDGTPMTKQEIERFVQVHSVGFVGQKEEDLWIKFEKRWQPNKEGLGMGHIFEEINSLYGDDFIRYKEEIE